jgi:hypothetical protein
VKYREKSVPREKKKSINKVSELANNFVCSRNWKKASVKSRNGKR